MIKCSICGEQIELRKENRYEVVIEAGVLQKSFGVKDCIYEAFDCPHCGCQMLMQERFPAKNKNMIAEEHTDEYDDAEKAVIAAAVLPQMQKIQKTSEQKKAAVRSRFSNCKCNAIETEWKDDVEANAEGVRDELQSFGSKVKATYGPENREADDVTLDYLQKMSDDDLLAFCGERGVRIPEEYCNRGYLIGTIKKHCMV